MLVPRGSTLAKPRSTERVSPVLRIMARNGLSRQASRITKPSVDAPSTAAITSFSGMVSHLTARSVSSLAPTGTR